MIRKPDQHFRRHFLTLVQMQSRPAVAAPAPVHQGLVEVMDAAGPQAGGDMSVEVALSVPAGSAGGVLALAR